MTRGRGDWAPLREPAFRWLAAARTAIMLGVAVAPIALAFAVLDLTGSARDVGLVVAAQSVSRVAFLLAGGVLADRMPRGLLLVGSCAASALLQALSAIVVLGGVATVPLLAGLAAVTGVLGGLSLPASMSMVPQTVPPGMLREANAIARLFGNSALIGGGALGGVIVAAAGPGWGLGADAAMFAVAAACYARTGSAALRARPPAAGVEEFGFVRQLREGWTEFRTRSWLWIVVLQFSLLNAAQTAMLTVIGPVVADDTFGRGAWGLILAAQGAGFLVGGFVALRWRPRHALAVGVAVMLVEAVPMLCLGFSPRVGLLVAAMFLCGVAVEQFTVAWDTSVQENVPADKLSRVYSLDALGSFVAIPVGQIAAGPAYLAFGAEATLVGCALLVAVPTLAALATRGVRGLTSNMDQAREA